MSALPKVDIKSGIGVEKPGLSPGVFLAKYQIDQAACFRFLRQSGNCHTPVALNDFDCPSFCSPLTHAFLLVGRRVGQDFFR